MSGSSTFKIGVIGFGEMGKRHALEYSQATHGQLEFTAAVEPENRRYEEGCAWTGRRPHRYMTVPEMLSAEKLDGLIIASPNCFHYENLKACAASGIPMMLEKPIESSFEKICDAVRLVRSWKAPLKVDHVMRYSPIIQQAKRLIDAGRIGNVCSFNFVQYHGGGALFTTFRRTKAGGGGQILEKATHDLDVAFYLCGAGPRKVMAVCRRQKFGGDKPAELTCSSCGDWKCQNRLAIGAASNGSVQDVALSHDLCPFAKSVDVADNESCLIECANGVFGSYSQCFFVENHFSRRYEIIGTEGLLHIELSMRERNTGCDGRITLAPSHPRLSGFREEYKFNYDGRIHYAGGPFCGRHFLEMIQGKAEPFTTIEDAFAAEMAGIGAMRSSEEGKALNLEKDVVPEDLRPVFMAAYSTNIPL